MSGVSLKTISRKLAKYKLHLVGVQEVRWDKGDTEPADDYTFFCGNGMLIFTLGQDFLHTRRTYQQSRQ
jgi:hypothetical protein